MARQLAKGAPPPSPGPAKSASAKPKPAAKAPAKTAAAASAPAKPAPAASAGQPASGNWRIQLGAFSQRGNAETLYRKLSGKDALSGRSPFYVSSGSVTRLQIGPFESKSAAQAACNALGVACFPVPAK
jgi:cell division septation protein DedD